MRTLAILLLLAKFSFSQNASIDNILPLVSLLQVGNTSSSGFFVSLDDNILFVTAKHSLINEYFDKDNKLQRVPIDNLIKIVTYSKDVATNNPDTLIVDFGAACLANYMRYAFVKDVVILFIGKIKVINDSLASPVYHKYVRRLNKSTWLNFLTIDHFLFFKNVHVGEDIIMGGYPKSLGSA